MNATRTVLDFLVRACVMGACMRLNYARHRAGLPP